MVTFAQVEPALDPNQNPCLLSKACPYAWIKRRDTAAIVLVGREPRQFIHARCRLSGMRLVHAFHHQLAMGEDIGEVLLKLGVALVIGTVIGAEREYKNKSAGLRTLILICLGSTLFTIISYTLGAESETGRIASNIVTGIGFLGAGAIMREGLTVTGLTTASSIWVTAALGMSVGAGQYALALFGTLIVLTVLTLFGFIQPLLERYRKAIELHITLIHDDEAMLEEEMHRFRLSFEKIRTIKRDGDSVFHYEVSGPKHKLNQFLKTLSKNSTIKSFEY